MRFSNLGVVGLLVGQGLWVGCFGGDPTPRTSDGPTVSISVAALSLIGVRDVVWDIEVLNGAQTPDVVWRQRVASSRYGDGVGSVSYVGPCDASPGVTANTVRLWVVGVYDTAVDAPGTFGDVPPAGPLAFENPTPFDTNTETWGLPLSQVVTCAPNADRPVHFDVALMRPAQQGFFDIAVNFNDIFCSAKFDCCVENAEGTCESDITLLHDDAGERSTTLVLGFACTAGAREGVETELYLDDILLDCTPPHAGEDFAAEFVINPSRGPGNGCSVGQVGACEAVTTSLPNPDDYLYQVAFYRGLEALTSGAEPANKVYWNIALGAVRKGEGVGSVGIEDCRLRTRGTADDAQETELVDNGVISAGVVYPYIQWDVDLGSCGAEPLTFGDPNGGVRTAYTTTTGTETEFPYGFGPRRPAGVFCAAPCVHGTCIDGECACEEGWEGSTCAIDTDDCAPNPCRNGGTCTDGLASYTCSCTEAYNGDNCEIPLVEVLVPAGEFWMGCDAQAGCAVTYQPAHLVSLSEYLIDRYPVTAAQYQACVAAGICSPINTNGINNYTFGVSGKENHPINYTTWYQANQYCAWSGKAAGVQRLCTEAEWEKAARGGCETVTGDCRSNMRRHPWDPADGTIIPVDCSRANYWTGTHHCGGGSTTPVDAYPGGNSIYGVSDMTGNSFEWVWDWYGPYSSGQATNPQGPDTGTQKVVRGGDFGTGHERALAFSRYQQDPTYHSNSRPGIRCCRSTD